jgi:hypothetical protein
MAGVEELDGTIPCYLYLATEQGGFERRCPTVIPSYVKTANKGSPITVLHFHPVNGRSKRST